METRLRHGMAALSAAATLGLLLLIALPSEVSSAAMFPPGIALPQSCPLEAAKKNFDSSRFLGNWYVLEYQYARKMRTLRDIGCVQLHYTALGVGDIISNFTFRYPPRTGFFFHVAEISLLSDVQPSVWETQYGTIELISTVVDTDYDNWAVLVQCSKPPSSDSSSSSSSEPQFLSTRVLSRTKQPSVSDWVAVQSAIEAAGVSAEHKFAIDQKECSPST